MRAKKYPNAKLLTICLDEKDVSYLDDHRGKVTRGDYLIESMYSLKNEQSQVFKNTIENYKKLSSEVHELKKQLMFEQSRNKKQNIVPSLNNDIEFKNWIKEKGVTSAANWLNLFTKNSEFLIPKQILNEKQLKAAYEDIIKNSKQIEPGA